jgi:iron(III) transport system substrate-binding protein
MKSIQILKALVLLGLFYSVLSSCAPQNKEAEVNLYTHRHYPIDEKIYALFTEQTGIKVNVVNASADELIQRIVAEGENSPADLLLTVDASRMQRAKAKNLLQPFASQVIEQNIAPAFIDAEKYWYAMTYRARVIAYHKEKVDTALLRDYEDLARAEMKGKLLIRTSENSYNQALMASFLHFNGEAVAESWAKGIVDNFARPPKGSDRDQIKAIAAGEGEVAVVNTYYIGLLLNDSNEENRKAAATVGLIFPNQSNRGTHVNVSSIGLTKYAPNKAHALRLMEFLSSEEAQRIMAYENYEYPANVQVPLDSTLKSWGEFKRESIDFDQLGELNGAAIRIFDKAGWK